MRDDHFLPGALRALGAMTIGLFAAGAIVMATSKGPDAGGYRGTDVTAYSFVDISGPSGGTSILAGSDDATAVLKLPFSFLFYGQAYTMVCVSSNGALYFVSSEAACTSLNDFANIDVSAVATPNDRPAALPFWTDLTFQVPGAGAVYYQTLGTSGSRRFIVQWNNAYPQGSPSPVTFQAILFEATGDLRFQYKAVSLGGGNPATGGGQATIGIRNTQAPGNQQEIAWSVDAPVVADSTALLFTAPNIADVNRDGVVTCDDVNLVKASYGKKVGQAGYNAAADVNKDGIVNITDLTIVTQRLPPGTKC